MTILDPAPQAAGLIDKDIMPFVNGHKPGISARP
jgi:hypothetical protein